MEMKQVLIQSGGVLVQEVPAPQIKPKTSWSKYPFLRKRGHGNGRNKNTDYHFISSFEEPETSKKY